MITIIPAIDIIEGNCVRLTRGDFNRKKIYNEDPVRVAKQFQSSGIKRLHVVDLDGTRARKIINWKSLKAICEATNLSVDFGGGVQSERDIRLAFACGAQQITAGSIAVYNRKMVLDWLVKFGSDRIVLGADFKYKKIAVSGWQEGTQLDLLPFLLDYKNKGINTTICTDVNRDGVLQGPNFEIYKKIKNEIPELELIASGGIHSIHDIEKLDEMCVNGVIIGKAIYENKISLDELEKYLC
jgi:phosphoribosylformimino-5-aminoimidazole carboxamide ribotide isomerase